MKWDWDAARSVSVEPFHFAANSAGVMRANHSGGREATLSSKRRPH
jgi:hypothetical protein